MSEEATKGEVEVSKQTEATNDQQAKVKEPNQSENPKDQSQAEAGDGDVAQAAVGEETLDVKGKPNEEKPQLSDPEEPEDDIPIVLVTGASGYLSSHITKQLLEQGRFRVRGTVRSLENEKKVKPLRELVAQPKYQLRLIEADLLNPKSWIEAVRRCSYVFHVASPISRGKDKNPDVVIKPAVDGTTNVLKACSETGTVKRVVLTSSTVAIVALAGDPGNPKDHVYTEKDWANEATGTTYERSKVKAEKAAWDLVKQLDENKRFELVSVCPGLLEGPILAPSHADGSVDLAVSIMAGKNSRFPDVHFLVADVRDVAAAHIAALEKAEAAGNRYIVFSERLAFKEIAQILANEFKPQGYKITAKGMPKAAMWAAKFVNSNAKMMYQMLGKQLNLSNEKMRGELGIEPRPPKDTLIELGYSVIEMGVVPKKPGYLGHPSTRPPPEKKPEVEAAAKTDEHTATKEPTETTEVVSRQHKEQQQSSEPAESQENTSEPVNTEEMVKVEEPLSEPVKNEELPSEPTKKEEPPMAKQETASEPGPQDEQILSEHVETPDEPANQEEPSEPAQQDEPSEPVKEAEPSESTKEEEPSEPAQQDEPSESTKEEEPSEPAQQDEPSEPAKEEEPSESTKEEEPSEPAKEEEPSEPAMEEEPSESAKEKEPIEPAKEEEPSELEEPSDPAKKEPSEPAKEEEPSESAKEEEPSELAKEEEPSELAKEEEPSEPAKEEEPSEPEQEKDSPSEPAQGQPPSEPTVQDEESPSEPAMQEEGKPPSTVDEAPVQQEEQPTPEEQNNDAES